MEHIQHFFDQGREAAVPKKAIMDEKKIQREEALNVITKDMQYQICYCRGYGISMNCEIQAMTGLFATEIEPNIN